MSPSQSVHKFASTLDLASPTLVPDLRAKIPLFPLNITPAQRQAFETKGTDFWNASTRLSRKDDVSETDKSKICLLRVFAFHLLDSAAQSRIKKNKNCDTPVRMLKAAFKSLKACIESGELEFAGKIAQRATAWLDEEGIPEDTKSRLGGEYFVWRMALSWKQDKLDVAEHMFDKFTKTNIGKDPVSAEELADVLFEIGKDLCTRKVFDAATRWLERALDALDEQELDRLSDDAGELRLSIMQQLAKSYLAIQNPESLDKARNLISLVDHDYSDKMVSTLLHLEVFAHEEAPVPGEYFEVLQKMVRAITMTRSNFKTVMHHIHKLKKLSTLLACKSLDDLIALRLSGNVKEEWLERACMMRVWIMTTGSEPGDHGADMKDILDVMLTNSAKPFSAAAAYAAQTLLWKYIESAYNEKQYEAAERYCELALHPLFEKCGDLNRAKISRKWILCALNRGDDSIAQEVFYRMSEAQRNAPETRYLMFRLALRVEDAPFASECLEMVFKASSKDVTYLYACVLVAQQAGERRQSYTALNRVLMQYEHGATKGIHLPALLRCLIRMAQSELGRQEEATGEVINTICELYETAANHARKAKAQLEFTASELDWLSKNSYNLALKSCSFAHPKHLHRLTASCKTFIVLLDRDTPPLGKTSLRIRHIICEYLAMSAKIVLARAEDNIEISLNHDLDVSKYAQNLRALIALQMEIDALTDDIKKDMIAKHIQSVKFELEAMLRLNRWDDIDKLFDECWKYEDPHHWATLADLAFAINEGICAKGPEVTRTYQPKLLQFIQRIINQAWRPAQGFDELARWIRCLFQIALAKDEKVALHCLGQAIRIAGGVSKTKSPYPPMELEWLAGTAYNHAVDLYCSREDKSCQMWAEQALTLAAAAEDNGAFGKHLREKYAKLRWDRE